MRSKKYLIFIIILTLLFSLGNVFASDEGVYSNQTALDDSNVVDYQNEDILQITDDSSYGENPDEIVVENWDDLQYYSSLNDKDYTLRLKENTNYYPSDPTDSSYQVVFNNDVTIIGASGAYIGDDSPNARNITYLAMNVPKNNGVGITFKNVTFKWIATRYQPDGVFLQMEGNSINYFENCYFTNITTDLGHSSIVHIRLGDAVIDNCTFINCTTDFGCLSVYNPDDDPTKTCVLARMNVSDSYFEGNYAKTEPGCINNCGILVVNNSTFYKNSAFWWAGAIHTHGGANTTIYDSDFVDNLAGWNGGALYTYSYLQIYNTRFIGNNCTTNNGGGAIGACKYLHAPYIHIEDSLFENNENLCWGLDELSTSGTGRGGAISLMDEGGLEVYNTTFIKNSASIGTAICAINGGLSYGSPDVKIVGNRFINHTRVGDVLDVRVATGSIAEISDNYFLNNSIVFSKLKLTADDPDSAGRVTLHLDAELKNKNSYDTDILDKSDYDVYVNGAYYKTVSSRDFTLDLGNSNPVQVYVVPCISNSKSNEVSAGKVKEYIYVSQSMGNDNNDGRSRSNPVKTLNKSIELANATENIVIMDGTFTETNLIIDYNLTITGETGAMIKVTGNAFTIKDGDVRFENVLFKNCKYGSSTKNHLIQQDCSGFLILDGCTFENNEYKTHIEAEGMVEAENLKVTNCKDGSFLRVNSIKIKSSVFSDNIVTYSLYKSILSYKTQTNKFEAENLTFTGNTVYSGCIGVKKNKATITDCSFIGNVRYNGTSSPRSSGIYIEDSCSVLVESSKFINNTDTGNYASVIYVSSGTLVIRDSILINNSYENTNGIVINGGDTYLKKLQAHNNWWGNTPDNLTKPALKVYGVSNQLPNGWDPAKTWLVLNASSLSNEIEFDKEVPVQFMFTQIDNEGNVTNYDGVKLPSFELELTAVNGTCSDSKITVVNGMATTYFTLTQLSSSSLTGSFNGINATINFQFKKSIPEMTIDTNDISVGDAADIVVNLETGATGEVVLKVGEITQTKTIANSKATFSIPNLPAGNYTIEANYTGNNRFESTIQTANLTVSKHNSTTTLSVGDIQVNNDVVFTITLSNGATGTVDVYVNGAKETINAGETYTIPNIPRGDYVVRAVYSGDSYYLGSEDEFTFDVGKFIPAITVTAPDITYGADTIVNVNLNSSATGSVIVTIDGKTNTSQINNGKATVSLSGINAGVNKVIKVDYSGDNDYKNATITKTYNVNKASLDFTINVNNIKLGQNAVATIQLPPRSGGTLTITGIRSETKNVPLTGLVTLTYTDLAVGNYTVSAQYDGDNYETTSRSATFEVSDWNAPQWPNEGYDVKNTESSPYSSEANGNVKWIKDIDGTIIGNMAIDSIGRIYITTASGIYSINPDDGSTNWIFNSQDAGYNFSGIAISRDTVLAPKGNDKIYFINQTTGEKYNNNIYQGSSLFAPIVDEDANIYTSGEYYGYEPTNLVVIPYKIWQTSTAPTSIEIGDYEITSSPVLVNNKLIVLTTTTRLIGVDLESGSLPFNVPLVCVSSPVVGPGNIIYVISNGKVYSYSADGSKLNNVTITGAAGKYLSVGENGEIYSVNQEGKLFDYSTGEESLVCDFKEPISSRLLVGHDANLYVGSDSGMFYAIDIEGNLLWKVNLNQSISASPVMDTNGVIYVISGNRIVAIDEAQLKDSELAAEIKNVTYGNNVTADIELNSEATGNVSIKIGNVYSNSAVIDDGKVSFVVSNLPGGDYTAKITYLGDSRFESKEINVKFKVGKIDPTMDVNFNNSINVGDVLQIMVSELPADATGTVSVSVSGKSNSTNVKNGKANISISGLGKGEYSVVVTYSGDTNYNNKTITNPVSVGYVQTSFNAVSSNVNVGQDVVINISGIENDANGAFYVNYNNVNYTGYAVNGNAQIIIHDLANGTYDFDVFYINDTKYSANSQRVHVVVSKITPTFTVVANDINVGDDLVVDVSGLPGDATGLVIVDISDLSKNASVGNGMATVTIPQRLANGTYSVNVTYVGDRKYNGISQLKTVKISKITPTFIISVNDINVGDDLVVDVSGLPIDATGTVNVSIDGISNSSNVENGAANVVIHQRVANGTYPLEVSYSGDDKYDAVSDYKLVNITKITPEMTVIVKEEINVGEDLIIEISNLPKDTSVNYVDVLGDITDKGLLDEGTSRIVVSNLASGEYSFTVNFRGDDRYNMIKSEVKSVSVNKISPKMNVSANNINVGEVLSIQIKLPGDITGEFVYISILDDEIPIQVNDGSATYNISGLAKGTYNYTVTYAGNEKYESDEYDSFVDVGKVNVDYDVIINDISYGASAVVEINSLPNDASGNITVIVNKKQYSSKVSGGSATISIPDLEAGEYSAEIRCLDEKYMANPKVVTFNVDKVNPTIDIVASDINVGEDLQIKVNLANCTGNVVVSVGEITKTVNINNGVAAVNISDLTAGTQSITVNYSGDNNYNSYSASKDIKVNRINPAISVEADNIVYGDNLIVRVNLPSDASGNVIVKVDGKSQSVKLNRGTAIANVSGLNAGTKSIAISYSGDDKYNPINSSASAAVEKLTPSISVSADNIKFGESAVVKVELSDKINGNIIVSAGEISKTVKAVNGIASAEIAGLTGGSQTISAKFNGDSNHNAASGSITIEVGKIAPEMTIDANDIEYGETLAIKVNLPKDATGNVSVSIDGISKTSAVKNGVASFSIAGLTAGAKTVNVKYDGDNNYYSSSASKQITVSKIDTPFSIVADDIKYGQNLTVSVNLDKGASGNVIISVGDTHQTEKIVNGVAKATFSNLPAGNYTATASYDGDENYNGAENSSSFSVLKANVPVSEDAIPDSSDPTSYSISLPSDATGTLTVSVDGKNYTADVVNGKATVNIPELSGGTHNIVVTYSGDDKYSSISKSKVVTVNNTPEKTKTNLVVSAKDIKFGEKATIDIKIASDATGKVTVTVNNKDYESAISKGKATLSISDLSVGKYDVFVKYDGDDTHLKAENSTSFSVLKANVPVSEDAIPESSDPTSYSISLPSDATGTLTVSVDGKNYTADVVNGKATVNIPELSGGSHNIVVTYSGDDKYSPITKTKVVKIPVIELTGSDLKMLYSSGACYKVYLTQDGAPLAGKTVSININGKTYQRTTDDSGYASLKIGLKPNAYTATAVYGKLNVTNNVVVKSIVKAKNVKAKKSAKYIKIKVSLKKVNKKYIKGKKVTLKFNKKKFKVKTNKKGVATFKIKNSIYKKLKVGKKYKYQVSYGKDKVKKTIKFKK